MLSRRVFETTIDVRHPVSFCSDTERHLMAALRNEREGRCMGGSLILRVVEVIERSGVLIRRDNGSGEGYVDVRFLAEVITFSAWDVLVGVRIERVEGFVIGQYAEEKEGKPLAAVTLAPTAGLETVTVGQVVSVRAVNATHTPMNEMATVYGVLLTCDKEAPAYLLEAGAVLDGSSRPDLALLLTRIEAELETRAALAASRKGDLWFFEQLLYSYRVAGSDGEEQQEEAWPGGPGWLGPPIPEIYLARAAGTKNVVAIARQASDGGSVDVAGVWSRPLWLRRSSPLATVAPAGGAQADQADPVAGTPASVFAALLKNILDFLAATRELCERFDSKEALDRHRNIWAIMRKEQLPM